MKRKLITLLIAVVALCGASVANAQFRWGAIAGVNVNTLKFKQDILTIGDAVGASAGINGEMMFPGIGFGIDIGLRYEMLGATLNLGDYPMWESQGYASKERINVHNIQIPFNLKFKYTRMQGFEDYLAPIVFGGPVFNIQAGHTKCDAIKFSGGDLGLTAGVGAEIFKRWQLTASYTWGMTYTMKAKVLTDYSARNRTWDIRVAYYF